MMPKSHTYEQLAHFIKHEMRMSHVYQPVMLRELLKRKGAATVTEVARALLAEDRSQLEYYEQITKNMVGRVLTSNRGITHKDGATYRLNDFSHLSNEEIDDLIQLCNAKVAEYLGKREDPWSHRRKSMGYLPGTQRYEVLKRARHDVNYAAYPRNSEDSKSITSFRATKVGPTTCLTSKHSATPATQPSATATTLISVAWLLATKIASQPVRSARLDRNG